MKCLEGFPWVLCREALHVDTALMREHKAEWDHCSRQQEVVTSRCSRPSWEHTSREFLSTAMWTMPLLSLHLSRMASWMVRSQLSPTSLWAHGYKQVKRTERDKIWRLITQAVETVPHMTGSNMFLIFRHGVRLLGGEFLRSRGKARTERQTFSEQMIMSEYSWLQSGEQSPDRSSGISSSFVFTSSCMFFSLLSAVNVSLTVLPWIVTLLKNSHGYSLSRNVNLQYLFPARLWRGSWRSYHNWQRDGSTSRPGSLLPQLSVSLFESATRWLIRSSQPAPKSSSFSSCKTTQLLTHCPHLTNQ